MANRIKVAIASSILTLRQQGWSLRKIARTLQLDRETVARHVHLAQVGPKPASNLSTGSVEATEPKPANPVAPVAVRRDCWVLRNPSAGNSGPKSLCEPYRTVIEDKLDQGLTAQRIWQDLTTEHGFVGRYASVKRFVRHLGKALPLLFRRMECAPGEQAQIDFGPGAPVEQESGRRKRRSAVGDCGARRTVAAHRAAPSAA